MSTLALFPIRIRFVDEKGLLTREAAKALGDIYARIGGPVAPTINELSMVDDEDSGLEEIRHETAKRLDALAMEPLPEVFAFVDPLQPIAQEHSAVQALLTELAGLREEVAALSREVEGLKQGTML